MDHVREVGDCGLKECKKNAPYSQILFLGECLSKADPHEHTAGRVEQQGCQMKRSAVESKQFEQCDPIGAFQRS